jgi:hypothetical protein
MTVPAAPPLISTGLALHPRIQGKQNVHGQLLNIPNSPTHADDADPVVRIIDNNIR